MFSSSVKAPARHSFPVTSRAQIRGLTLLRLGWRAELTILDQLSLVRRCNFGTDSLSCCVVVFGFIEGRAADLTFVVSCGWKFVRWYLRTSISALLEHLQCPPVAKGSNAGLDCLLTKPASALLAANEYFQHHVPSTGLGGTYGFRPSIDGVEMVDQVPLLVYKAANKLQGGQLASVRVHKARVSLTTEAQQLPQRGT